MRLAHVRPIEAGPGAPWRLAAALDDGPVPARWLELEAVRRRAAPAGHPLATLDDHLAGRGRVADLRHVLDGADPDGRDAAAILPAAGLAFGPPILRPPSIRDFFAFERHARVAWERRGRPLPEAWYRLPVFYFGNAAEVRGPGEPVWAPRGSAELDVELEVAALVDVTARDLDPDAAEAAIGGYTIFADWSARDLQREEAVLGLGPAKGKDFANSFGPWLVTPDELADVRTPSGYDLAMTVRINGVETGGGRWSEAHVGFHAMLARASADATVRAGDLLGSGTVGSGSLYEVGEATLGRWLEPGDEVVLAIERLGELRTPIVARP